MGYVHSKLYFPTPITAMFGFTATWSIGAGQVAGTSVYQCDATDESTELHIPLLVPKSANASQGFRLEAAEVDFEILTAACDAMSAVIRKITRGADGAVAVVDDTTAFSYDTGHDTAAERIDVDQHKMTLTLTTPVYIDNDEDYEVVITFDKAATTTVDMISTHAIGTLRA